MARRYRKRYGGRKTSSTGKRKAGIVYSSTTFARGVVSKFGNFKLRGVIDCASDGANIMNHGVRITQPDNFNGSSSALTDWTSVSNLYDEYRVRGIKIRFIPSRPNDSSITITGPTNNVQYQPVYVFADFDSVGLNPTVATCVGYGNLKVKDLTRPWSVYYKIPKLANYSSSTISRPGWMDTASPTATGSVYIHAESLSTSLGYGKLICDYYITLHNRK